MEGIKEKGNQSIMQHRHTKLTNSTIASTKFLKYLPTSVGNRAHGYICLLIYLLQSFMKYTAKKKTLKQWTWTFFAKFSKNSSHRWLSSYPRKMSMLYAMKQNVHKPQNPTRTIKNIGREKKTSQIWIIKIKTMQKFRKLIYASFDLQTVLILPYAGDTQI